MKVDAVGVGVKGEEGLLEALPRTRVGVREDVVEVESEGEKLPDEEMEERRLEERVRKGETLRERVGGKERRERADGEPLPVCTLETPDERDGLGERDGLKEELGVGVEVGAVERRARRSNREEKRHL